MASQTKITKAKRAWKEAKRLKNRSKESRKAIAKLRKDGALFL